MEYIDILQYVENVENVVLRRERILRDRLNPIEEYNDLDFFQRYRFTKETVLNILETVQEPLLRRRTYEHNVLPVTQLLVALRLYATGSFLKLIGDSFGIHVCTISRVIRNDSASIASLRHMYIAFPNDQASQKIKRDFMALGNIPGVVGAIDCTHVPIQSPANGNAELFRNRKGYFSINVQAICDSDHRFTNIVVRWPGSTHDARIFDNSEVSAKLESGEYSGILLGDNGYPLKQYLLTPILQPRNRAEQRYNTNLSRIRVRIENLFGIWKRRFPCLRNQLRLKLQTSLIVVVACAVLHNIARNRNEPVPDGDNIPQGDVNVPVQPVNRNEGGQALRRVMVERFQ